MVVTLILIVLVIVFFPQLFKAGCGCLSAVLIGVAILIGLIWLHAHGIID